MHIKFYGFFAAFTSYALTFMGSLCVLSGMTNLDSFFRTALKTQYSSVIRQSELLALLLVTVIISILIPLGVLMLANSSLFKEIPKGSSRIEVQKAFLSFTQSIFAEFGGIMALVSMGFVIAHDSSSIAFVMSAYVTTVGLVLAAAINLIICWIDVHNVLKRQ
jgi:hypothetical protein